MVAELRQSDYPGRWWTTLPDGRVECRLCPRFCKLNEGQRGFCFVRQRAGDQMVLLTTYGRSSGFVSTQLKETAESFFARNKRALFGTAGCNLGCRFCPRTGTSPKRASGTSSPMPRRPSRSRSLEQLGCRSVAFTYNDPVIFAIRD